MLCINHIVLAEKKGAVPEASVAPTTEPTVAPTEKVEATATPDQKEDITVQDTTLPNTPSDSDEETDDLGNATEKDNAVEIEEDDIANSGAEADEEDDDQDTETEDESDDDYDDEDTTDTEEVEEDEIASSLPQTGVMSVNVFYYIGSMICAFGICVLTFIRKKTNR